MRWSFLLLGSVACMGGTEVKVGSYNAEPSVTILNPVTAAEYAEGDVIQFEALVSDNYDDPDNLKIFLTSDIDGELASYTPLMQASPISPSADGAVFFSTANLSAETADDTTGATHVIGLLAEDSEGASSQAFVQVTVLNLPEEPTVTIVSPTSADVTIEGDLFLFQAEVWDARDALTDLRVTITSDIDDVICQDLIPTEAGNVACSTTLSYNEDQHLLTFTATNTANYRSSATTYFAVTSLLDVDNDGDGFTENQGDCDDTDIRTYLGAAASDNVSLCMRDFDGDGYGDANPSNGASPGMDCDDTLSTVNPSVVEMLNGEDDDCDGFVDNGTDAFDDDGDGYSENQGDCDDTDLYIHPGRAEICGNNIDDNCNGTQNEKDASACTVYYQDADNDGYGSASVTPECWCLPGGSDSYCSDPLFLLQEDCVLFGETWVPGTYNTTDTQDCYDGNNLVTPNQTGFFDVERGDGSFDYNCDNLEDKASTVTGKCAGLNLSGCGMNRQGWANDVPACGITDSYINDDNDCTWEWDWFSSGCEKSPNSSFTQTCK